MSNVTLSALQQHEKQALQRLLQLYYFESAFWSQEEIEADGLYDGCTEESLDAYIDSPVAIAYLIRVGDKLAGFALIEEVELEGRAIWELADLFVLPNYRGGWVALEAVRQIVKQSDHPWLASTFKANALALRFFQAASKRLRLASVRELIEAEFFTFIINEQPDP